MRRLGIGLMVIGAVWTAFAWWLVIPEVILLIGILLLMTSGLSRKAATRR